MVQTKSGAFFGESSLSAIGKRAATKPAIVEEQEKEKTDEEVLPPAMPAPGAEEAGGVEEGDGEEVFAKGKGQGYRQSRSKGQDPGLRVEAQGLVRLGRLCR